MSAPSAALADGRYRRHMAFSPHTVAIRRFARSTGCHVANRHLASDSPCFSYFASTPTCFCRANSPYTPSARPVSSTLALTLPRRRHLASPHPASPSLLLNARSRRSPIAFDILSATLYPLTDSPTRPFLRIATSRRASASFCSILATSSSSESSLADTVSLAYPCRLPLRPPTTVAFSPWHSILEAERGSGGLGGRSCLFCLLASATPSSSY